MNTHEHEPYKIVANRPGLVTLACRCGKLNLWPYKDAVELQQIKDLVGQIRRVGMPHPLGKLRRRT